MLYLKNKKKQKKLNETISFGLENIPFLLVFVEAAFLCLELIILLLAVL